MMQVTVVGVGYVGLPTAIAVATAGFEVTGFDLDVKKINSLKSGKSFTKDISDDQITHVLSSDKLFLTSKLDDVTNSDVFLICVPTPLNLKKEPDLTNFILAINDIGSKIQPGNLVIIESTVATGTIRKIVLPLLESVSGLSENEFYLAYSPERIDPANSEWNIFNTPKLISGLNSKSIDSAFEFYSKYIKSLVICSSLEIAETAKLLENSFRYINISFINELSVFCNLANLDVNEIIKVASTKPYGFMPFYPSIGVGGHCIPVDPIYLAEAAKSIGAPTQFISLADKINQSIPNYFVGRAEKKLDGLKAKRIVVIGVAYKPNISDVRESPVKALITGLQQRGAIVSWHDDLVKEWDGSKSVELSDNFDLAILATPHDYLDLTKLGSVPILNTRSSI